MGVLQHQNKHINNKNLFYYQIMKNNVLQKYIY